MKRQSSGHYFHNTAHASFELACFFIFEAIFEPPLTAKSIFTTSHHLALTSAKSLSHTTTLHQLLFTGATWQISNLSIKTKFLTLNQNHNLVYPTLFLFLCLFARGVLSFVDKPQGYDNFFTHLI